MGLTKNMGRHLYAAATATESALDGQDAREKSICKATRASASDSEGRIRIIPLGQSVKTNTADRAQSLSRGHATDTRHSAL